MKDRQAGGNKKTKGELLSCPRSLSAPSPLLSQPPLQGMFWGPAHILFAQCIPAGSLFMSIFLLIRVRLPPVTHSLLLWVKEPTCDTGLCVCLYVCVKKKKEKKKVWGLRSRASLPSINMAKWFPHMVKYLCKVIWLAVELKTSGCDLHPRWPYLHCTYTQRESLHVGRWAFVCEFIVSTVCLCAVHFRH